MSLHYYGTNGKNVPHFSDFLLIKNTIRIFYKYNTETDTDTEYLFNVVYVKHDTT